MARIVIIGNGISGVTAARHIRKKSDQELLIISGESPYFFSRTALMYVYMGHMRFEDIQPYEDSFWEKNRIGLLNDWVTSVDFGQKKIHTRQKGEISYDKLVLALGSKPKLLDRPGVEAAGVQGLYSRQDLEQLEINTKGIRSAVIVGGGLIGVELAEMLASRDISVHFLIREKAFMSHVYSTDEAQLITRHLTASGIQVYSETELQEIHANTEGHVTAVTTQKGERIACEFVGLTIGVTPRLELVSGTELETNGGILINRYFETSVADVYAIGDCAEHREVLPGRSAVEQVWYTGRIMGETLAANLTGEKIPYTPGNWFNSAKFFEIEYQTYGLVPASVSEKEQEFYWEHPDGRKAIRFVWERESGVFRGVNSFGIRLRHEVFDHWLRNEKTIREVMTDLAIANFDPEFYKRYEAEIRAAFAQQTGYEVLTGTRGWWKKMIGSV